jgi:hypothetical protein
MKPMLQFLRTTLVGGLLFLVPIIVLVVVLGKALVLAHQLVDPLAEHLPVHSVVGLRTPILLAIAIIMLKCLRRVGAGSNAWLRGLLTSSLTLGAALAVPAVFAQPAEEGKPKATNLALELHNPVATLVSVHLENDWDFGYGNSKAMAYTASLIPVVPFSLSRDWNLITRTVVPVIYAESPFSGGGSRGGLGDIVATLYLSPDQPMGGWYWGVGPGLILPSATDPVLGAGKWSAGPTAAVLRQDGPWTAGALTGHAWSFASTRPGPAVSTTYLQPFLSYTTKHDTTFGLDTTSQYDWKSRQWTVPLEVSIGQVLTIARQQLELDLTGRWYAERALGGPQWGLSLTLTFLFPK